MFTRRTSQVLAVLSSAIICAVGSLAFVDVGTAAAGTGPGASGNTITNAAQAQTPYSAGTFDSGQPIDVVVPANSVLTPGATIFILECAAPNGVDPTTINSCDGNTGYGGGTISVNSDGSIDVINSSTNSGDAYNIYALPDHYTFRESPSSTPKCGLGSANECVLYIGQGGGGDIGLSQPHFFSQAFQVHTDPTDSGTLNPGDGTFPADAAPAITSAASYTFTQGTSPNFTVTATGYPAPTFSDSGSLDGLTLNATTGALSGTPTTTGTFTSTITASNGVTPAATQAFSLTVNSGVAPAITSASSTTFSTGTAGTFTVTATGTPAPTFTETGNLPGGVTLNSTTGVLSGTPAAGTAGSYPITITASNGVTPAATQAFTLNVGPGTNGETVPNAAQAQSPFSPGTFDSGQPIDVVVPPNHLLTPGATLYVLECAAPHGVDPTTINSCDGNTSYGGGSINVNSDGSVDVMNSSTVSGDPYTVFALPDHYLLRENPNGAPKCGLGSANECVLYIGQGGGNDIGLSAPHVFSQPFQVHADPTDSGILNPGDGTYPADAAPAITSANSTTFATGTAGSFTVTGTGYPPITSFTETGTLPSGVTLNASTGVLSGTTTVQGVFNITITASNGVTPAATQAFTLNVGPGTNGETVPNAAQAQSPFSPGTFDSGQPIDVVVPPNHLLTPGATLYVLECAAPHGVDPTTINSCDGNTSYGGGSINVNSDGSVDVMNSSTVSGDPYTVFALPDHYLLRENPNGAPKCGLGSANECVLYIGQGGGNDIGLSAPHVFSQPFQVHADPTDSGILNPGDGTYPADAAPAITSANSTTFATGTAGSFTVTGTGYPPITSFTETGTLPSGVTLNASTGVLSGTTTVQGVFNITITASNGVTPAATQAFTLTVDAAPQITSAASYTFTQGTSPNFTVTATGYPTPTFSDGGGSLDGLTLDPNSGVLSGTPAASGTFTSTITASNGVGSPATQPFSLTVNPANFAPTITSASSTTFTVGTAGSFTVTATGNPAPTFSETGNLPSGVSLDPTSGVLSGTPAVGSGGSYPITITATNGVTPDATQSFTLTVNEAPTFTSASSTNFVAYASGTFTPTASGFPTPVITESGTLPAGVTFTGGVLAGTPTVSGTFPITFTATNGVGSPVNQSFTLTVSGFEITTTSLPDALVGTPYSVQLTTAGSPPGATITWKKVALPKGFALSSTGLLTATPSTKATGAQSVQVSVTDAKKGTPVLATFPVTVNWAPAFGKKSPIAAGFTEGQADSVTVTATGSPTPTFTLTGTLPTGVSFDPTTGVLSGTPAITTDSSQDTLTIVASNGIGTPVTETFTLSVYAPLVVTTAPLTIARGATVSGGGFQLATITGTEVGGTLKVKATGLPKSLALSATGLLTGTVKSTDVAQDYPVTITASSKDGKTAVTTVATVIITVT